MKGFPCSRVSCLSLLCTVLLTMFSLVSAESRTRVSSSEAISEKRSAAERKEADRRSEAEEYLLQMQAKIFALQYPKGREKQNPEALLAFLEPIKAECKDLSAAVVMSVVQGAGCAPASTKLGGK